MKKLKLLIADDHRLMLRAIRTALEDVEDMEIVGEVHDGAAILPAIGQTQPDVVLLDLRMPRMDGLQALDRIRQRYPKVRSIVLSGMIEPETIAAALRRGASAFVAKHIDPRDLPSAIRQVVEGTVTQGTLGLPEAESRVVRESGLTARELEILRAVAGGSSNRQIGRELFLTEQTIKFHLTNIYRKLGVRNRTEAAHYAYREGLVDNPIYQGV